MERRKGRREEGRKDGWKNDGRTDQPDFISADIYRSNK